ncbi:MAG: DUF4867 family protein [Clostridia bacterium]|nr:DUF4867 family protein [Clostridia bacterium]
MITDCFFKQNNPLYSVNDSAFNEYGRVYEFASLEATVYLNQVARLPAEGNTYIADNEGLRQLPLIKTIQREVFGELPVQAGWCCGNYYKMNGVEWHKSSEVIIAATDMVLLLGHYEDITDDRYDSAKAIGFYLKKGDIIELYPMVLHFAPLKTESSFNAGIILPTGTNLPLDEGISGTLRAKNKWLLVHPENINAIKNGGKVGIDGENITLCKYEKN